MEKVLVTGATGFIGLEVARQLSEAGYQPRVMVRRPRRGQLLNGLDVEPVQADLRSPESLRRAVDGVDTVMHLAARATFEDRDTVWPTIVEGSERLAEAAADAGVERFVYASSLLAHGEATADAPLDAATDLDPVIGYGEAKRAAEARLRHIAERAGMRLGRVRLPHVYGARDLLFERVRSGFVVGPGRSDHPYAHLHVEDAARVLIAAGEQGWVGGSPVADDQHATWRQFFDTVRTYYPDFRFLRVPSKLALLGARLVSRIVGGALGPTLVTPDTVVGWNLAQPVRRGALWDELGITPRYPTIDDGIPAVLDACIAFRWKHSIADRRR